MSRHYSPSRSAARGPLRGEPQDAGVAHDSARKHDGGGIRNPPNHSALTEPGQFHWFHSLPSGGYVEVRMVRAQGQIEIVGRLLDLVRQNLPDLLAVSPPPTGERRDD